MVIISIAAIFLGLLVPSITLFMQELINNRVITIDDIANLYQCAGSCRYKSCEKTKQVLITKDSARDCRAVQNIENKPSVFNA